MKAEDSKKLGFKKAPRAGFGLRIVPKWRARVDLAKWLSRQLSKRFGHIPLYPGYLFRASILVVSLNNEKFHVRVHENKYPGNNPGKTERIWVVGVNPSRFPVLGERFTEDEQEKYAKDLLVISNEIHAALTGTPEVTGLRWWFAGWDFQRPGVPTPAKLPWSLDAAQLGSADGAKIS